MIYSENASWKGKDDNQGAQIDLLIDRDDNIINLCEMKFSNNTYTISKKCADELRTKAHLFKSSTKTNKNVFITMVTTYGLNENEHSLELIQNSLKMDCLFEM